MNPDLDSLINFAGCQSLQPRRDLNNKTQATVTPASQGDKQADIQTKAQANAQAKSQAVVEQVNRWVEQCVIDLSLCPFASFPYRTGKVRIAVCDGHSESDFLKLLQSELTLLRESTGDIETTLVVCMDIHGDFLDFNDFLADAEALLKTNRCQSEVQIASFHPQYRFAGVDENDAGNFTNRAPFPIVQWLRTDSVTLAVESTDTSLIPQHNIQTLQSLDVSRLRALFPWVY